MITAGLALVCVSGKRRVPAPPPRMIDATVSGPTSLRAAAVVDDAGAPATTGSTWHKHDHDTSLPAHNDARHGSPVRPADPTRGVRGAGGGLGAE